MPGRSMMWLGLEEQRRLDEDGHDGAHGDRGGCERCLTCPMDRRCRREGCGKERRNKRIISTIARHVEAHKKSSVHTRLNPPPTHKIEVRARPILFPYREPPSAIRKKRRRSESRISNSKRRRGGNSKVVVAVESLFFDDALSLC